MQFVLACLVLGFFVWLLIPDRERPASGEPAGNGGDPTDDSAKVGSGTGIFGGDVEDAAIVRYTLERTREDSSSPGRDFWTAVGMQRSLSRIYDR